MFEVSFAFLRREVLWQLFQKRKQLINISNLKYQFAAGFFEDKHLIKNVFFSKNQNFPLTPALFHVRMSIVTVPHFFQQGEHNEIRKC
jgi:hypothetical protein